MLKEDEHHDAWEIPFKGEIVQQGLEVMVDPNFDPKRDVKPGFEQQLFDLQLKYFWSVVLYVLQNPFGKTCVSEFYDSMNGRAAFHKHRNMQLKNAARMYDKTALLATFHTMSLAKYNDT